MTKFYKLNPECPGGLGNDAIVIDRDAAIWQLSKFQIVLERFPQDDLIESMLAGTAVTEKLAHALMQSDLNGFELAPMEVVPGDQLFLSLEERQKRLPQLSWLKIVGLCGINDFGTSTQAMTVVSEKALKLLKQFKLDNCDIEQWAETEGEQLP
jgi:hypothetical protein